MGETQTLLDSLLLCPRHECGGDVRWELTPPHKGCGWTPHDRGGKIKIDASDHWILGESDCFVVFYCPFCGAKLPEAKDTASRQKPEAPPNRDTMQGKVPSPRQPDSPFYMPPNSDPPPAPPPPPPPPDTESRGR